MTASVQRADLLHERTPRLVRGLHRIVSFVVLIHDAFTEAQAMARAAHRNSRFVDWS